MQRYGASRIQQVMLSEGGIASICHRLKRRWKMHARWSAARRRHPGGSASRAGHQGVPRIPETRTTGEDKGKRHGDAAVAVALAYFASREINHGPVAVKSRRRRTGARITQGY